MPGTSRGHSKRGHEPYRSRRLALARRMRALGGGVAVLFTAPEAMRNRDSDYPYRWDSYFYYLTGFPEPEAALVMTVDAHGSESMLFCRERNEEREIWDGLRYGPKAARAHFGLDRCEPVGSLDEWMAKLMADRPAVFHAIGADGTLDARMRNWLCAVRAQSRSGVTAPGQAHDLRALLDEMRLLKDDHELALMRRAGRITADAHVRAMKATRPGRREYEIEAELLHEFRTRGSQSPAYGSIVAGGANACVLHYRANDQVLRDGTLLLIDAGCELDGYASDITRTFPVGGRFSAAQRRLYDVVLEANRVAIEACAPNRRFADPHDAALRVLTQGLIDTGLLKGTLDGALESGAYRRFYMHRTSHWLGMDVHDCGEYREPGEPADTQGKPWRVLRPGMVLTIEPGLYVRAAADIAPEYHDIGIRIEDDVAIRADGHEVLTRGAPKRAADIERLMRGAR